jgi:hypothetical protein
LTLPCIPPLLRKLVSASSLRRYRGEVLGAVAANQFHKLRYRHNDFAPCALREHNSSRGLAPALKVTGEYRNGLDFSCALGLSAWQSQRANFARVHMGHFDRKHDSARLRVACIGCSVRVDRFRFLLPKFGALLSASEKPFFDSVLWNGLSGLPMPMSRQHRELGTRCSHDLPCSAKARRRRLPRARISGLACGGALQTPGLLPPLLRHRRPGSRPSLASQANIKRKYYLPFVRLLAIFSLAVFNRC